MVSFPLVFPSILHTFLFFTMHATCPVNFIPPGLIILIIRLFVQRVHVMKVLIAKVLTWYQYERITGFWTFTLSEHILKNSVSWNTTPCDRVEVNRRFWRTYYLHLQSWRASPARSKKAELCLISTRLHGVISQKTELFITTGCENLKTYTLTYMLV
jgi:hypothetical protein